jgi:hypothetical protein
VAASLTARLARGLSTSLGACCYKTHVRGKHKGFCILLFALLILSVGTSCTSHMTREDDSVEETAQTAQKADEDEVVETGDSASASAESSEEESENSSQKTAGVLMSIGYLAMSIGMTILPLLMM